MKKARLQKVVDHLRKVRIQIAKGKAPEFDMRSWGNLKEDGIFKNKKKLECVTSACAIGHAAHLFKSQGFHLEVDGNDASYIIPVYKGLEHFPAIAAFFGISEGEANYLFHPTQYGRNEDNDITVSMVADRIENFINGIEE